MPNDKPGERHAYGGWSDEDDREFQEMARVTCQPSPARAKKKREAFVKVPMWWAEQVCKSAGSPQQVFVALWLLYRSWKTGSKTVSVPNVELRKLGVDRRTKYRALTAFERAGLLKVERPSTALFQNCTNFREYSRTAVAVPIMIFGRTR
jgi:hypothetical protein